MASIIGAASLAYSPFWGFMFEMISFGKCLFSVHDWLLKDG
jgi:hypothetical protein